MNTFIHEITLTPRTDCEGYNAQVNEGTIDILSLLYEFKIATGRQIARFLEQREESKYLYLKLRRMWRAGLVDSFRVYTGVSFGIPVYYVLTKTGLEALASAERYSVSEVEQYPKFEALISLSSFRHEAAIVELASLEAKNHSEQLALSFRGEFRSITRDVRSQRDVEIFTPDFTARYSFGSDHRMVYTEFERTPKAKAVMLATLKRYLHHLNFEERERTIVRFLFQTPVMEDRFWKMVLRDESKLHTRLHIMTSNASLIFAHQQFLEPIYLSMDLSKRVKLIPFL